MEQQEYRRMAQGLQAKVRQAAGSGGTQAEMAAVKEVQAELAGRSSDTARRYILDPLRVYEGTTLHGVLAEARAECGSFPVPTDDDIAASERMVITQAPPVPADPGGQAATMGADECVNSECSDRTDEEVSEGYSTDSTSASLALGVLQMHQRAQPRATDADAACSTDGVMS